MGEGSEISAQQITSEVSQVSFGEIRSAALRITEGVQTDGVAADKARRLMWEIHATAPFTTRPLYTVDTFAGTKDEAIEHFLPGNKFALPLTEATTDTRSLPQDVGDGNCRVRYIISRAATAVETSDPTQFVTGGKFEVLTARKTRRGVTVHIRQVETYDTKNNTFREGYNEIPGVVHSRHEERVRLMHAEEDRFGRVMSDMMHGFYGPRMLAHEFKGSGGHYFSSGNAAGLFERYFAKGGVTGGRHGAWKSGSLGDISGDYLANFRYGENFLMVLNRFSSRRAQLREGEKKGLKVVDWGNVNRIFMNRACFDHVKTIYQHVQGQAQDNGQPVIGWKEFCQKIILVESDPEFNYKMKKFARFKKVDQGLTADDLVMSPSDLKESGH